MRVKKMKKCAFLFLFSTLSILALHSHETSSPLRYGDRFPFLTGTNVLTGQIAGIKKGYWNLIYYTGSPEDVHILKYLEVLRDKFNDISVLLISETNLLKARPYLRLSYPMIVDQDLRIKRLLGAMNSISATFFVDPGQITKFANYGIIRSQDLRMLAEQYLLGETSFYNAENSNSLKKGDIFPNVLLREIGNLDIENLIEKSQDVNFYIVWSADCTQCVIDQFKDKIRLFQQLENHNKYIHIFSSKFDDQDILNICQGGLSPKGFFYIAALEMPGLENLYYEKSVFEYPVATVYVDKEKRITEIESFTSLLLKSGIK